VFSAGKVMSDVASKETPSRLNLLRTSISRDRRVYLLIYLTTAPF